MSFEDYLKFYYMKSFVLSFGILILFLSSTFSQTLQPLMTFEKVEHDFGQINEEKGKVEIKFEFVNTGNQPLIIGNVKASCGCTTPSWSKDPVAPGNKGYITVVYNPLGRPGKFNKSVTINSNSQNDPVVLKIIGDVIPRPKTIEDNYPQKIGNLRLKEIKADFSAIKGNKPKTYVIPVTNTGNEPIDITFQNVPDYLSVIAEPQKVQPQGNGNIKFEIFPDKVKDWGYFGISFFIVLNRENNSNNRLFVSGVIEEDFSNVDTSKAPKVIVDNEVYEFKNVKKGTPVSHAFKIHNNGKSDLIIHKTKGNCSCLSITSEDTVIKPNKTSTIQVVFDTNNLTAYQNKNIQVICNDPKKSTFHLWIKGLVEK